MKNPRLLLPRVFAVCAGLVFLAQAFTTLYYDWVPDYSVFYIAARTVLIEPHAIYDPIELTIRQLPVIPAFLGLRPWAYPPSALLPLLPFSILPFAWSYTVWVAAGFGALMLASKKLVGGGLSLLLVAISNPVFFSYRSGQTSLLIGAVIVAAILLLPRRPVIAGALLGLAASVKPQLLVLVPVALMATKQFEALVAGAASGLLMVCTSMLLGPSLWLDWVRTLPTFLETVEDLHIWDTGVTPTSLMWNLGITGAAKTVLASLFSLIAAIAVWNVFRRTEDPALRIVALVGGALLCAPYAMSYDLAILAPAAVVLMFRQDTPLVLIAVAGTMLYVPETTTVPIALAFVLIALRHHLLPALPLGKMRVASIPPAR